MILLQSKVAALTAFSLLSAYQRQTLLMGFIPCSKDKAKHARQDKKESFVVGGGGKKRPAEVCVCLTINSTDSKTLQSVRKVASGMTMTVLLREKKEQQQQQQ